MQCGACSAEESRQHAGGSDGCTALQIVCAWCQQLLHRHRVQTPTHFTISYSICARCYAEQCGSLAPGEHHDQTPSAGLICSTGKSSMLLPSDS
jgi:hypothetical protein